MKDVRTTYTGVSRLKQNGLCIVLASPSLSHSSPLTDDLLLTHCALHSQEYEFDLEVTEAEAGSDDEDMEE